MAKDTPGAGYDDEAVDIDIDAEEAAEAQEREATGGRIAVRLGGRVYHFKPMTEWAYAATSEDDLEAIAEDALPEEEVKAFLDYTDTPDFSLGKFRRLMDRLTERSGLGRGKQRGSSKRSRPRRKR
ncbi:hypothetical protein [Actinomadura sp. 3N508]|uniref:hypothetical protein n=1 Tax=Actinomadura sp. 3N508 TaxID=3375153 RepID=UPI0037A688F3